MSHIRGNDASSGERGEPLGEPISALVDAYIDGRMNVAERAAFEARLTREPDLRAEVAAYQRLESMLREQYAERPAANPVGVGGVSFHGRSLRVGRWWLGAAAVIAVVVALWQWGPLTRFRQPLVSDKLVAEYSAEVAGGFVPREICTTNEAFIEWTVKAYGIGISPAGLPASVQLLGWTKRETLSSYTGVLLARVDGREVVVFMDPSGLEAGEAARSGKNLRVFSQRIGGLTLYEVTPGDRPAVLPGLALVENAK